MSGTIKKIIIVAVIAVVVISEYEFFTNLFQHIALISFIPLLILIYAFIKHDN